MAGLNKYGVLAGRPIAHRFGAGANDHYQVRIIDNDTDYRIAINVKSAESPSELLYLIDDDFQHPLLAELANVTPGFHLVDKKPGGIGLDFIRGNLFDRTKMKILPGDVAGPDNDLNEEINRHIQRAINDEHAMLYAFGQRWGPEPTTKDKYFGFLPGNGIHDIHMNQGNVVKFKGDDGVWQDGGLLIRNSNGKWTGIFMVFQSQAWHTDDVTGHTIPGVPPPPPPPHTDPTQPPPSDVDLIVRIIAALVNPRGDDQGTERVTLLNTSDAEIDLGGWAIANRNKAKFALSGKIEAGATKLLTLPVVVPLSNDGGIITLLNRDGLKVHGVQYTKEQAKRQGWTLVF